jgi:hypothetical protein
MAPRLRHPGSLTWAEVAPDRHRFDPATALEVVRALRAAQCVPSRPAGGAGDDEVLQWSWNDGASWVAEITSELVTPVRGLGGRMAMGAR